MEYNMSVFITDIINEVSINEFDLIFIETANVSL